MPVLRLRVARFRRPALLAAAVILLPAIVAGAQANSRTDLTRLSLNRMSTSDLSYAVGGFIAVPASWSARRTGSRIHLRDGDFPHCIFDTDVTSQAVQSNAGTPADAISAQQNVGSRYVIDSGTRGRGAWRVVRVPGGPSGGVTVVGDLLVPYAASPGSVASTTWVGLHAIAQARAGSECHSGMYRQAVGPQIGDALASYRGTIRPALQSNGR